MYGYIYLTTNCVNHKMYIGKKVSDKFLERRYLGSGTYLKRAIDKYGEDSFTVELLQECNSSEELDLAEVEWIERANAVSSNMYYNLANGVRGNTSGSKKSNAWKQKMSEAHLGTKHTAATRHKISTYVSGTAWVYNELTDDQLKVQIADVETFLQKGYRRGRRPFSKEHREALSVARRSR